MDATTVTVDLAKDVFKVAFANRGGRIFERKRLTRPQFERFIDGLTRGTQVVMEACGTAHYWGRRCLARGLRVRLLPGQYVRPYVRRNKTDRTDAEALLETNRCGGVDPVPVKTREQQTLQVLHRVRTQWQAARTARMNAMRGILRELGFPIGVGARTALRRIPALLEDATIALPELVRQAVGVVFQEVRELEARIDRPRAVSVGGSLEGNRPRPATFRLPPQLPRSPGNVSIARKSSPEHSVRDREIEGREGQDRGSVIFRGVAQPGRASGSGPEGRWFESSRPDYQDRDGVKAAVC
jgi:hypothetical protein